MTHVTGQSCGNNAIIIWQRTPMPCARRIVCTRPTINIHLVGMPKESPAVMASMPAMVMQ